MFSQKDLKLKFGNPKIDNYEKNNIIMLSLPFEYIYSGNSKPIKIRCHKLVEKNFIKAHELIWSTARKLIKSKYGYNNTTEFYNDKTIEYLKTRKLNVCGGSFNIRAMRGSTSLSHHSYGIAIDIDPIRNPMSKKLITTLPTWYIDCWKEAGFEWGGDWENSKDSMHFEVAKFI